MLKILLVDDDPQSLESTRKILGLSGYEVICARDGIHALEELRKPGSDFSLVISDVRMPRMDGLELFKVISQGATGLPVILMTAFGKVEDAVWAMKLGAVDFLTKPFKRQTLSMAVELALKRTRTTQNKQVDLLGESPAMKQLKQLIEQVASSQTNVMITGESGTGKELVARAIHQKSTRSGQPFVAINCAAIPENLLESELFGYEKGAFTGADISKAGLFESAHGGTLLLDEIGDMPLTLQVKLLRVLQDGEVRRIGSNQIVKTDVRVIASTNQDLKEQVKEGRFRADLLYRLEVIGIRIPPLRERALDVLILADIFIRQAAERDGRRVPVLSDRARRVLGSYPWPGNVRELQNVIERALVLTTNAEIEPMDLPPHLCEIQGEKMITVPVGAPLREVEEILIRKTLEATSGDKNRTAKLLGIASRTIYRKLNEKNEE